MAAPTMAQIREAFRARLDTISGVQASAYYLSNPTPPAILVVGGEVPYDETLGLGLVKYEFILRALAGLSSDVGAQKVLDEFVQAAGAKSIKATINADPTLGGVVHHADVMSAGQEKIYVSDVQQSLIGREFLVEVLAAGV